MKVVCRERVPTRAERGRRLAHVSRYTPIRQARQTSAPSLLFTTIMPRKTLSQPRRLKQGSLDTFVTRSSSPIPPSSPITPGPSRIKKAGRSKQAALTKTKKKRVISKRLRADDEEIPSAEDEAVTSSDPGHIRFEPEVVTVMSSEEDEDIVLQSPQVTSRSQAKKRKQRGESDEPVTVSSDEENVGVPVIWKGKGRETKRSKQVVDSDSEEEPPQRRLTRVRPATPESDEDLLAEVDENSQFTISTYSPAVSQTLCGAHRDT